RRPPTTARRWRTPAARCAWGAASHAAGRCAAAGRSPAAWRHSSATTPGDRTAVPARPRAVYGAAGTVQSRLPVRAKGQRAVHIVVMGCGRLGSSLAHRLEQAGHYVAIIDQNPLAFRRLGPDFAGSQVSGNGFDQQTLRQAGIEQADAFAAVSSGDNSNIISARGAREAFNVDHVAARIYDPKRPAAYEQPGIPALAHVQSSNR